jgi:hydroxypyruvate isomerase
MRAVRGELVGAVGGAADAYWELIGHIQIADVPGRREPGTGEINHPFLLGHIAAKGYQGAIGAEYRPSTARTEDSLGWLEAYRRA